MAMPRKGSRPIVVDNVSYRWRIRHKETYDQLINQSVSFMVSVEAVSDAKTTTLVVDTGVMRSSIWQFSSPKLTPENVERYIRLALRKGWQPYEQGKPFLLAVSKSPAAA